MKKSTLAFFAALVVGYTFSACNCGGNKATITDDAGPGDDGGLGTDAGNDGGPGSLCLSDGTACSTTSGGVCSSGVCGCSTCSSALFSHAPPPPRSPTPHSSPH